MVLKRLSKSLLSKDKPSLPAGRRAYAVGDVHGRLDLLQHLLAEIAADHAGRGPAEATLIFLGDLIDRGPDSMGVIDLLRDFRPAGMEVRFLLGNHDEVFLKALLGDERALRMLTRIGGKETILSYGVSESEYEAADFEQLAELLKARVPEQHVAFLRDFEDYVELGDYLFVHAGIRPDCPIAEQRPSDLRWIRDEFLSHRTRHPKMVVHGHSISSKPELKSNRIGIDTGAFGSGVLTCVGLEGSESWFLAASGEPDLRWGLLTD